MPLPLTVILETAPVGKERPKLGRGGNVYTPRKTAAFEQMLAVEAARGMRPRAPFTEPVRLDVHAQFAIPKSWPNWRREAALGRTIWPTSVDLDNVIKAVQDALNGVVFQDDRQVVRVSGTKVYAERPSIIVSVTPLPGLCGQVTRKQVEAG